MHFFLVASFSILKMHIWVYDDLHHNGNNFLDSVSGPKLETVADFWRMVWEQKTATIVMLTNLKERKEVV